MPAVPFPEAWTDRVGLSPGPVQARMRGEPARRLRRSLAAALRSPLLAAAPMPLLLGLAAAITPEPVTLGLAGLGLAGLSLRLHALRRAERTATRHRDNLARLTAPAIARTVAEADPAALRAGWEQEAVVLFADIRGFTHLCEGLAPGAVAAFLTDFRTRATEAIEAAGGLIDKFVGDEVMAVFGVPDARAGDADRAVTAARALTEAMSAWSRDRARAGLPEVRVGVGLHRGPVFLGAIGARRLEFTAVGDTVNVARRLEQMTRTLDCDCLASAAVVQGTTSAEARIVAVRPVRGGRAVLRLFAIRLDAAGSIGQARALSRCRPHPRTP